MQGLHNQDQPDEMSFDWFYERVQRNCAQMRRLSDQLCRIGVPSVFDCGLTNSTERAIFADWAEAAGYAYELHFVDVPADVRWTRVQKRNAEQAETFQFEVTREMFDFIESIWEAPTKTEQARMTTVRITG
jgi:predicted kinase